MINDNDFKGMFHKLHHTSSEVPENLWSKIQLKINKRKRFLIAAFTIVFMVSIFSVIYFSGKDNDNTAQTNIQNKKLNTIKALDSYNSVNKISDNNLNDLAKQKSSTLSINSYSKYSNQQKSISQVKNIRSLSKQTAKNYSDDYSFNNTDIQLSLKKEEKNLLIDSASNNNISKNIFSQNNNNNASSSTGIINGTKPDADEKNDPDPLSISVFVSPDLPYQKINYYDSTALLIKQQKSAMHLSFTIGTRIQYNISKHFMAALGIQYSQVNDKITDGNNTTVTHFKTLDFPMLAGYTTNINNFNIGLNAGIIVNINAVHTNNISGTTPYPFYLQTDDAYKSNTGISYYAGINFSTNQNKRINLFAEPYFKYRPSNITIISSAFDQKINTAGILLGVRYNFLKNNKQ